MGQAHRKVAPQNSCPKDVHRRTPPTLAETHQPCRIAVIFAEAYQAETQKLEIRQTPLQLSFSVHPSSEPSPVIAARNRLLTVCQVADRPPCDPLTLAGADEAMNSDENASGENMRFCLSHRFSRPDLCTLREHSCAGPTRTPGNQS